MFAKYLKIYDACLRRWRRLKFSLLGMELGPGCWIQNIEVKGDARRVVLGREVALDRGVTLIVNDRDGDQPQIEIGASTYINRYSILDVVESIKIGEHCMIGPHCVIVDSDHGTEGNELIQKQPLTSASIPIKESVTTTSLRIFKLNSPSPGKVTGSDNKKNKHTN